MRRHKKCWEEKENGGKSRWKTFDEERRTVEKAIYHMRGCAKKMASWPENSITAFKYCKDVVVFVTVTSFPLAEHTSKRLHRNRFHTKRDFKTKPRIRYYAKETPVKTFISSVLYIGLYVWCSDLQRDKFLSEYTLLSNDTFDWSPTLQIEEQDSVCLYRSHHICTPTSEHLSWFRCPSNRIHWAEDWPLAGSWG